MICSLRLQSFRSYKDESFEFEDGVNIIVGPNASGKTNLLEAILVSCRGSSYRVRDADLVFYDAPWARLDAQTDTVLRTTKLHVEQLDNVRKEFEIGDQKYKRLSHQKRLPVVLFEPDHLRLLSGSPELRREYLDGILEQLKPEFGPLRRHYKRTLAQRNALLKTGSQAAGQLFAWNVRLSQLGGHIAEQRLLLIEQLNARLGEVYEGLSHHQHTVLIKYKGTCASENYGSQLLHKLEKSTDLDIIRGFTAYGPHRDDWAIELKGHEAETIASRGEVRTLLLALKILELEFVEAALGHKPILLLDDVFSELDGARRRALTEVLQTHQTFITTTDADVVVEHFMGNCTVIPIQNN